MLQNTLVSPRSSRIKQQSAIENQHFQEHFCNCTHISTTAGTAAYLSLTLDSDQEADRVFALLSADGEVFLKMQETFFASRFAMLRDKFGTSWMLLHPKPRSG